MNILEWKILFGYFLGLNLLIVFVNYFCLLNKLSSCYSCFTCGTQVFVIERAMLSKTEKDISAFRAAFSAHSCMHVQSQAAHADYPKNIHFALFFTCIKCKRSKNPKKNKFNHWMIWEAAICWSKYKTVKTATCWDFDEKKCKKMMVVKSYHDFLPGVGGGGDIKWRVHMFRILV